MNKTKRMNLRGSCDFNISLQVNRL